MQKNKIKNILITFLIIAVVISAAKMFFRKQYKLTIITNVFSRSFSDTLAYIHYYKDDFGPGVETGISGLDTPFCFNGINHKNNLWYLDFAAKGDILYKKSYSDSFYIKRKDSIYPFKLIECRQY